MQSLILTEEKEGVQKKSSVRSVDGEESHGDRSTGQLIQHVIGRLPRTATDGTLPAHHVGGVDARKAEVPERGARIVLPQVLKYALQDIRNQSLPRYSAVVFSFFANIRFTIFKLCKYILGIKPT